MTNNVIAVSPNVEWNISNCEIQTVKINTNYTPYKRTYKNTYQVINKCDNSIISEYVEWGAGFWMWAIIIIVFIALMVYVANKE